MKNKKILISLIIVIVFIIIGVASYFMFFNSKQIESIEIDKKDHTYVLKNINDNYLFQIHTTHNDYDIYDIEGHKIDVVKEYSNSILTIQSKDNYKDNKTYVIRLKDKDSFVDEKLKNARIIYFGTNEALTKEKLNYEVTKLNIKDSYTLQDNKIRLGDLTAQLSIELLNKNIDLKLKEYQAFIDDKKMKTSSIKATKGKHKIKIQFNYDDKKYEYEKEVNIKESKPFMISLKPGVIYTKYDITGDTKKDKIKFLTPKNSQATYPYDKIQIYINNKKAVLFGKYDCWELQIHLVHLSSGQSFLWICGFAESDSDPWQSLYQYKNGKMIKVLDFAKSILKYGYLPHATIKRVSDNKLYVEQTIINHSLAGVGFMYTYQYENEQFHRTSNIASINDFKFYDENMNEKSYGTLRTSRIIYTSPTSKKKKGVIKKGEKAKPIKIYISSNKVYIQIKSKSGKIGWIENIEEYDDNNLLFEECFYVS